MIIRDTRFSYLIIEKVEPSYLIMYILKNIHIIRLFALHWIDRRYKYNMEWF